MDIIEELFYGNIDPNGKCYKGNVNYDKAVKIVIENENLLLDRLGAEDKKLFTELINAHGTMNGEMILANFKMGFQIGARIGVAVSDDVLGHYL